MIRITTKIVATAGLVLGLVGGLAASASASTTPPPLNLGDGFAGQAISQDGRYDLGLQEEPSKVGESVKTDLVIVDRSTNKIAARPRIGDNAAYQGVTATAKYAYVAEGSRLTVISLDPATLGTLVTKIPVGVWTNEPHILVTSPDGQYVYVAGPSTVYVVNATSNVVVSSIPVAPGACKWQLNGLAVSADSQSVFALNRSCIGRIDRPFDPTAQTQQWTQLPAGLGLPVDIVASRSGSTVYIALSGREIVGRGIGIVDGTSLTWKKRILADPLRFPGTLSNPQQLAMSADGKTLYIQNNGRALVPVPAPVKIPLGSAPFVSMMNTSNNTMSWNAIGSPWSRTSLPVSLAVAPSGTIDLVTATASLFSSSATYTMTQLPAQH